mmetsp:Transcript_25620/g.39420  ORF Transcript_25620/g.39420 Transcript_25620/m.39420 type:complete len:214 (+) Transcript_25620:935-1576(+)|eukprot:CAMPEP_0170508924 /NCGR_PEP_ID=MMETSP0208-20121228/63824_1 /TAXON_ID=197538 /ORGANISM="Strombidium inclinatum, Strain S3" /LENGTH=213 /DNA_ID=CAMNT_0010792091 /DNA_START=862 /DNA_END=1503 /DNA_ORIENTATION=+
MLISPYICYLIAEGIELSGIVSILTNGIFLNYYGTPNVQASTRKVTKGAVETIAYITESMVFLFLGIGVFAIDHPYQEMGWGSIMIAGLNLNLARALNIWVVTALVNRTRTVGTKINGKQQFVMWVAGLRGAMAYALALDASKENMAGRIMLVITLLYALFTILIVSSILYPVMTACQVTGSASDDSEHAELVETVRRSEETKNCTWKLKRAL